MILVIVIIILILLLSECKILKNSITKFEIVKSLSKKRDVYLHDTFINKHLSKDCNILNFGCGLNTYASLLKKNYNVTCLDIEDNSLSNEPIILYDGINIPGYLNKFDFVIISTVLHHIPDENILSILNNLKSITKNIIIIEDYIDDSLFSYFKACIACALFNFSFFNRSYSFKTKDDWIDIFNQLKPKEILYENDDPYECYVLKF